MRKPVDYTTLADLQSKTAGGKYEIMRWDDMMVEIIQQLKVKTAVGMIIIAILYMIVGFGIFGTVIMMTNERTKEFGVIISVGMQKSQRGIQGGNHLVPATEIIIPWIKNPIP